jgi:hypothetical protein
MTVGISVASGVPLAEDPRFVEGVAAYNDLEPARAAEVFRDLLAERADLPDEDRATLNYWAAAAFALGGDLAHARLHFRNAITLAPDAEPPTSLAPKTQQILDEERRALSPEPEPEPDPEPAAEPEPEAEPQDPDLEAERQRDAASDNPPAATSPGLPPGVLPWVGAGVAGGVGVVALGVGIASGLSALQQSTDAADKSLTQVQAVELEDAAGTSALIANLSYALAGVAGAAAAGLVVAAVVSE